jgi:hypothetical protein
MIKKTKILFIFLPKWVDGITLFKKIFVKQGSQPSGRLLTHEYVHVKQQNTLGLFKFYTIYILMWMKNLIKTRDAKKAYKSIKFEEQAYRIQNNYPNISKKLTSYLD